MIKSPLNYLGNKYSLLEQILPHFPETENFVDLFGGSFTVGINVNAKNTYYNEIDIKLFELVYEICSANEKNFLTEVEEKINKFGLNKNNREAYTNFRDHYNNNDSSALNLFILLCHSYNHQLRFNKKGKFNTPQGVGTTHFSPTMKKNFSLFNQEAKIKNIYFSNTDYSSFNLNNLNCDSLIYCDPPYLISLATYNENKSWTETDEKKLLDFLDEVNSLGIKFVLSNVVEHKGKTNKILLDWIKNNGYNLFELNKKYKSQKTHKISHPTREVLIKNY